ncbi:hypothetical protein GCK72_000480 [Caenorhabditis remanei]|uniref:Uncharacterized protein n=1 Tax=Caenorhabditis remanei TaxID=31234 RepID=A0A6A5HQT6_CAERE|nr:hypothetical protein GCK72_000480 [Caenorhabditis remanei]KAF1768667.1 hypothetical protein GCK72_000480 [Caenorhabditis remanei]
MWTTYYHPKTIDLLTGVFWNQRIKLKYNGRTIRCRITLHPERKIPLLWCREKHLKALPIAINSAICDVFNTSSEIRIMADMDQLSEFPNIDSVDNLLEYSRSVDQIEYQNFFDRIDIRNALSILIKLMHSKGNYEENAKIGQSSVLRVLNVDPTQRVYLESLTVSDEIVNLGFSPNENAHVFEIRGFVPGWRHIYIEINRRMLSSNTHAIYLHPAEENLSSHEVIATPQMDVDEDLNAE